MKRNHLLIVMAIFMVVNFNCKKHDTDDCEESCVHTVAYWKTHPAEWQVNSFFLGSATYTKEQALVLLNTPANGNTLLLLAQELIAIRLNTAKVGYCEDLTLATVAAEDRIDMETDEGDRFPPFGDIYSTSEDARDLAAGLRRINEGEVAASCCDGNPED